jgi:hypothetical protein
MRDADGTYAITGGCRCGSIRYRVTKAPLFVMACHCTDCQEQTSSAFSLGMPVDKERESRISVSHVRSVDAHDNGRNSGHSRGASLDS